MNRDKLTQKAAVAAEILGYSVEKTQRFLERRALAALPISELPIRLPDLDIDAVERIGTDLIRIDLKRGRTFFGHRSEQKEYLLYHMFRPIIPAVVDGAAYKLALDIQRRYLGPSLPDYMPKGGIFIEGGCFTGLRAMRWHDALDGDCRIIAVEIGAPNVEIMRMNLEANGITAITPVHAGLWREDGEMEQKHAFTTRRFLEETDRWAGHMKFSEKVETLTIDTLLDRNQIDVADYMNIQVNGAEIEVLKGFKNLHRIKVLGVAAYYSKEEGGPKNVELVRELMVGRGCRVIGESAAGRITFATPGSF
jgi:FkbM family methyltransferase